MAIAVTQIGGGGDKSASASIAGNTSGAVTAGDLVVVAVSADNAGTAGVSSITSVTDSVHGAGSPYIAWVTNNRTPAGAANDGVTVKLFYKVATSDMASGTTITVNFSPNTTAKTFIALKVTETGATDWQFTSKDVASKGVGTSYLSGTLDGMASGDLLLAMVGNESNTAPSADTGSTGGSWDAGVTQVSGGSGGDGTKQSQRVQWKVLTGTSSDTFGAATGANTDFALIAVQVHAITGEQHSGSGSLTLTPSMSAAGKKAISAALGTLTPSLTMSEVATGQRKGSASMTLVPVMPEVGKKATSGAGGTISLTATLTQASKKGGQGSSTISLTPTFSFVGGRAYIISLVATLAATGKKAVAAVLGTISLTPTISEVGTKGAQGAPTMSLTASLPEVGKKAVAAAAGSISLTATLSEVGKKGAKSGAITLAPALGFSYVALKQGKGSGSLALTATLAATGTQGGAAPEEHSGSGSMTIVATLTAVGRKQGKGAATLTPTLTFTHAGTKAARGAATMTLTLASTFTFDAYHPAFLGYIDVTATSDDVVVRDNAQAGLVIGDSNG